MFSIFKFLRCDYTDSFKYKMDKTKIKTRITVFCAVILIGSLRAQDCGSKVDRLYIKDSVVPMKGQGLQLNCIVNNFKDSSEITLTRSDLQGHEQMTKCITSYCTILPFKWRQRYTVSSNNSGVFLQIKNLNRSADQNTWTCKNLCAESKRLQFTVHTVPQLLQFDNPPSQDEDLVQNTITLKCSTGCCYPQPSFTWFYNETGGSRQEWSSSGSVSHKAGGCTDSERIYTSTFSLPRYTTLPDNEDKTLNFSCGITSFPGLTQSLFTSSYVNVRFAVFATTPTITGYTTENRVVFENDTVTLECISSMTRPVALVAWKKGSNTLTNIVNTVTNHDRGLVSIKSTVTVTLNRNDNNKRITCETYILGQENKASLQQGITVYWPPSTPSIPTINLPFLEGQSDMSIYCQATEYGNPTATALWSIKYGTQKSSDSRRLNLPILSSQQDQIPASCQLKNQFTETKSIEIQSRSIKIAVEYSPVVKILESNNEITTITKNEGQHISILCNVTGNPEPTVKWNGQTLNDKYLRFDDLDRADNGTYTCKASAISTSYPQHNFKTEKKLDVVVNYAPVVTVVLSSTDLEEGASLRISCKATGQPNTYTYTSMFQTWGTVNIPNRHSPVNGIINIRNLKIEDSGTYTCLVNNGIADRNNKLDQSGNVTVIITASPKVLLEDTTSVGAIGKSVNISAPFYSYPDIRTVEFRFQNGSQITTSSKYGISYQKNVVKYSFYGKPVELEGYIAVLQIMNEEETDFMNYTLILDNGIGSPIHWTLKHISESRPSVPRFFNYTGLVNGVPTFLLKGGFNGGRLQTFVIETAKAGSGKWMEQLRFNENDKNFLQKETLMFKFNITGLGPNSYDVRVRVGNDIDWIADNVAPKISFTIPQALQDNSAAVTAGALGGASSALIVIVVLVVVVVLVRREIITKDCIRARIQTVFRKKQKKETVLDTDGQDNSIMMYEHLQHTTNSEQTNVYDVLKVDSQANDSNTDKYENFPKDASTPPTYMNIAAGSKVNQTYENLNLHPKVTDGK